MTGLGSVDTKISGNGPVPRAWAGGSDESTERLLYLQAVRGLAAIAVVIDHVLESQLFPAGKHYDINLGRAGVLVFFVLSGFIMAHACRDETPLSFARSRIIRVVPLYWLMTLVYFAILLRADIARGEPFERFSSLVASLFFIPHYHLRMTEKIWPVLIQGWTLHFEMLFFLLFGMGLICGYPRRVAVALLLSLSLAGATTHFDDPRLLVLTDPLLLLFVAGIIIAEMNDRRLIAGWRAWLPVGLILLVIGALAPLSNGLSDFVLGIGSFIVVAATLGWQARRPSVGLKGVGALGDASYSIYLSHTIVLIVLGRTIPTAGVPLLIAAVAAILICIVAGLLLHAAVERPMTAALRLRFGRLDRVRDL